MNICPEVKRQIKLNCLIDGFIVSPVCFIPAMSASVHPHESMACNCCYSQITFLIALELGITAQFKDQVKIKRTSSIPVLMKNV